MSFFYDLNKKLDSIRATPEVTHQQLNERDMSRAAKGYEKYGKQGMEALAKAGREGKALDPVRKKYDKYDNKQVDEGGEIVDGVYKLAIEPKRPEEAENKMTRGTRPADKQLPQRNPPVVDKSRPAKSIDEGPFSLGKKIYNVGKQAADEIGDYYSRNPKTGELNTLPDRDMKPGETFDTAWERMQDERAMRQGRGEIKQGNYGTMRVDPKTGAYVPQPPVDLRADEGLAGAGKKIYDLGKRAASGINKMIGHGSDEEMLDTLRKDVGVTHPTGGKRPTPPGTQSTGDTPRDIFLKGETGRERAVRLGDPRVKNTNDDGVKEAGAPMTPKQKSFAKLAPPANKITFADKIAGAKKEVDEMLGDVAAEAMRSALGGGRGRNAEMDEERSKGTAFDMSAPRAAKPKVGSVERGHKHDIKHTATGRMVTRRTDDQGISVGADDDSDTQAGPRGRGRPKGTKGAIGAKGPSGRSKLMTREGEVDITDQGEYDQEGDMAKDDIKTIVRHAQALSKVLGDNDNLPEWVQSKLAKIEGMMISIDEYMQNQESDNGEEEPIAEKAVSKQQQKFMGMAHAMQKGEKIKGASKELKKVAKTMKPKDTEDFAKTKHKGLPDKVKKKEVDEDSDEGRLKTTKNTDGTSSTSSTTGRISATLDKGKVEVKPAKSSSGMSFGKGIYDSMNRELEQMIAESMSINMSDSTEGNKSLTVTATDDDAMKLAMMLKSAGLGGQGRELQSDESCPTCGMPDCGCGDVQEAVDENSPDWPTNTETSNDALQYAGGLNKPKTDVAGDGQTTIPNTAVHTQDEDALRRMMEMAGLAEAAKPDFLDMDKDGDKEESMKKAVDDKEEDSVDESIQRMREMAGIKEAKKPDFLDMDKDGDKEEPMSKAVKDKEEKKVDESIFALTNQWKAYKG